MLVLTAVLASGSLTSCKSSPRPPENAAEQTGASEGWSAKMRSLSETLSSLMPMVSSKVKFNDDKNHAKIESDTRKLRELAHSLKLEAKPNSDPSLRMMSGLFDEDIERALESLRAGHRDYARQILRDTTAYCIQCHTQTDAGPKFPKLNLAININELSNLEKAEFYAATRQFDLAIESYTKALSDEKLIRVDPFAWEQAARSALAIVVRVKADPKEARVILTKIESHPALPSSTKKALESWKKSVREWEAEKPRSKTPTVNAQLERATAMIKTAQRRQEFPLDHSQDVLYFRAASLLHGILESDERNQDISAKALYWAGIAAEATRDMNFWTLHENYYEHCIRTQPHSNQAQQCFTRLNDSVTLGYSGSGGVRVPPEISKRLEMFRALANPEQNKKIQ